MKVEEGVGFRKQSWRVFYASYFFSRYTKPLKTFLVSFLCFWVAGSVLVIRVQLGPLKNGGSPDGRFCCLR